MDIENFITKIVLDLLKSKFSIFLVQNSEDVGEGGWIDVDNRQMAATIKGSDQFNISTLIHEYSHFLQWKNNRKFYDSHIKSCGVFFNWLDGEDYSDKKIKNALKRIIELELDCEHGVVDLVKRYELNLDMEKYIKSANAYIMFYHIAHENREWCDYSPSSEYISVDMSDKLLPLEFYLDKTNILPHQREKYLNILIK